MRDKLYRVPNVIAFVAPIWWLSARTRLYRRLVTGRPLGLFTPGIVFPLLALLIAGCASTEVTSHQQFATERLLKPAHIWVYDFAATPEDVPRTSGFANPIYRPAQTQTPDEIAQGREVGAVLASVLVQQIHEFPAELASKDTKPDVNDLVIRGYFLSLDPGSATKRFVLGFGSGKSQLTTAVEGYQMTASGLRKLDSGTVHSGGNKTPGEALGAVGLIATANPVGLIVGSSVKAFGEASGQTRLKGRAKDTAKAIANQLHTFFAQQGWLNTDLSQTWR